MDGSTKVQSTVPDDMELSDNRRTSEEEGTATDVINMRRMGKPQLLQVRMHWIAVSCHSVNGFSAA